MVPLPRRRALLGLCATPLACNAPRAQRDPVAAVAQVVRGRPTTDGAGATLRRIFPSPELRHLDPFVLLDDFDVARPAGFPTHPHRGFEAFTYMIEGAFEHRDDLGNHSLVTSGGIQRFNSGRGARHSEMPGSGARNRGLQLWVNLPRRLKSMAPEYEERQALPVAAEGAGSRRTIVGRGSPVALRTAVDYADVELPAGASFARAVEPGWSTLLYVIEGRVSIGAATVERGDAAVLSPGQLLAVASGPARFAYLSGRPHGEPILQRGPFVD